VSALDIFDTFTEDKIPGLEFFDPHHPLNLKVIAGNVCNPNTTAPCVNDPWYTC